MPPLESRKADEARPAFTPPKPEDDFKVAPPDSVAASKKPAPASSPAPKDVSGRSNLNVSPPTFPLKLVRGDPALKKIALTFDDGPHAGFTEELIRVLKDFNVPATFFMIGRNVDANPELAKKAFESGIELAGHTYTHSRLPSLSDADIKSELTNGADAIERATGFRPRFYRPPGGEYDKRVSDITKQLQMTMVLWTSDAGDYTTPLGNPTPEAIVQKVMRYAGPGGIIIMHDPMPSSLKALPQIISTLRARGYEFVTVSEMAAEPKAVTVGGPCIEPRHAAAVQVLADQGRYSTPNSQEAKNASPEQRAKTATTPQGTAGQGTHQRG